MIKVGKQRKSSNHHLIPRVYLRSWVKSGENINRVKKDNGEVIGRNLETVCSINNFHSIKAGMPCCKEEELRNIFIGFDQYEVLYNGKKLDAYEELNQYYYDIEKWTIKSKVDGKLISSKQIKAEVDRNKVVDIEDNWDIKYEDKWKGKLRIIEERVNRIGDMKEIYVDEFYKGYLVKFSIALCARGFIGDLDIKQSLDIINNIMHLDDIDIPYNERVKAYADNFSKEMDNNIRLDLYRDFLNNKGILYDKAKAYIKNINIQFLVSNAGKSFVTSDNPSFFYKNSNGIHTHIMPITPHILMRFCKLNSDNKGKYNIRRVDDNIVDQYNKAIIDSCYMYYFY